MSKPPAEESRRDFIKQTALAVTALAAGPALASAGGPAAPPDRETPWYRRTLRWGQTNITEIDPARYDIGWWREHWKRTADAGRHHQRRRHRGLLSQPRAAAPPGGAPRGPRSLRRTVPGGARGRAWSCSPGWTPTAPTRSSTARIRTGSRWTRRPPAQGGRTVRHLRQRPVLRRAHPGHPARDRRAIPPRGVHRQQLERAGARHDLLLRELPASVSAARRQGNPPRERLERRRLPRVDPLELRPPAGNLGPEQPDDESRRRAGLHLGRHEQRQRERASVRASATSRPSASAPAIIMLDHQARSDATGFQHNGEAGKLIHGLLGLGQARPREHGHVPGRAADIPAGQQARSRSPPVDAGRHRGRAAALVASHRRVPRGPPHVSHRGAGLPLAQGARGAFSSTGSPSPRSASCGRSRTRISTAATRPSCSWSCRGAGSRRPSSGRASPTCRCTPTTSIAMPTGSQRWSLPNLGAMSDAQVRRDSPLRCRRRRPAGHRRKQSLRRVGRSAPRLRARRPVRGPRDRFAACRRRGSAQEAGGRHRPHLPPAAPGTACARGRPAIR